MNDAKARYTARETRLVGGYSQRELDAYRNIGTLKEFRRLKHNYLIRKERRRKFRKTVDDILVTALVLAMIEVGFFLCFILSH